MHPQNISDLGLVYDRGLLPYDGFLTDYGRVPNNGLYGFNPRSLFANGEQGVWYDPSDLTPEKVSWRRNLLTYSQDFENAEWTKTNASILSNLALYSQDFDNAAWQKTNVTVTANAVVAPDGTTTADKIEATTAAATTLLQNVGVINATSVTFSFYGKQGSGATDANKFDVYNVTTASDLAVFNVNWSTGVVTVTLGAASTTSTDVGNGWWRITATVTTGITSGNSLRVYPAFIGGTETANEFSYLWGAQLVPGSTAQTYTRSLATAPPIMFVDPFGETQADKLIENTANNTHRLLPSSPPSGTAGLTYTFSVYVKAAERTFCLIDAFAGTAESYVYVNLSTGAAGSNSGTYTIVDAGNGWYRVTATVLANGTAGLSLNVFPTTSSTGAGLTYLGDGTSGIYVYGAQVEQASTASAYQRITNFNGDFSAAFPNHALYQESVGPSPVTALGQSVGLVLDKRLGPPGPELVANGTFADGTGWTFGTGWELGSGVAAGISASGNLRYAFTSINGATYRVQFDWTQGGGTLNVRVGGGTATTFTTSGTHATYVVGGASTTFGVDFFGGAAIGFLDNVSVRLVSGNHALQATSASRPTVQARSNLLTRTEEFENVAWTNVGTPTVTANTTLAPDGTTTADTINDSSAVESQGRRQTVTIPASTTIAYTSSVYILKTSGTPTIFPIVNLRMTGGTTVDAYIALNTTTGATTTSGAVSGSAVDAGTYWRVTLVAANNGTANTSLLYTVFPAGATTLTTTLNVAATGSQVFWGAQVEAASAASTYQRVVTATDYVDVGLPRNLLFDGVDDSLATAGNVDFSATDKVTLFSGLFKASDAAQGIVTELTASAALNTGAFNIQAPSATPGTNRYAFESKGSVLATANVTNAIYAAPRTDVVTMQSAISTDALDGRINGTSVATSATDQGTGNYASALLYVGRRGGTTLPFNGRLFQLVICGAATGSDTVRAAERWVGRLTGVQL